MRNRRKKLVAFTIIASAVAATPLLAGQSGDQVTISLSGATFMRNFTTSAGISLLTPGSPGTDITLLSNPGGAPVVYKATSGPITSVQLAPNNLGGTITANPSGGFPAGATAGSVTSANYAGLRIEWHEQGSIEGVLELINDQVKAVPSVLLTNRNPQTGNPTWVNRNQFTAVGTINGYTLSTSTFDPTFGGATFNDSDPKRPGTNIQGGQNRVQMAISDVNARQGFAVGSSANAAWHRVPGTNGYGKGNQALNLAAPGDIQGLGAANVRHELNVGSIANMNAGDTNPNTGTTYGVGPWNTAGVDNLNNVTVANGGLTYIANPGTGMTRVNRTDATWLHTTGRLANGADFNVATRDEFSGTINTAVSNIGLDVSWSTGENDNGNGNAPDGGTAQTRIGSSIKFSNKTSGSSQVRPTVQNARMGFGHLTSSESVPVSTNSNQRPLRVMEFRDDDNDLSDGSNNALPADRRNFAAFADPITGSDGSKDIFNGFTRMSALSLVEGSYVLRTNQTYVTVKDPKAAFAGDSAGTWAARTDDIITGTGIKGDNHNVISTVDYGNDVYDFRKNILDAVANFPSTGVANPADELLTKGFILPAFVKNTKLIDGLNQDFANPAYNASLSSAFLGSSYVTAFNAGDPRLVMQGNSSLYGNNNIGTGASGPVGGSISINANNWLFGDFDQTGAKEGIRDFSDLAIARQAQAALFTSGLGVDWNVNAGSNATAVAGVPAQLGFAATKGDLIVLGDYDADGDFDGRDLYRFARGAALADNTGSTTLTTASGVEFGDMIRKGVLRKNAALDSLASSATAQQKIDASASLVNDPTGANAFNKRDVNRDGLVDFVDAVTSDKFFNQNYTNLDQQLAATSDVRVGAALTPISLVNAELNDTGNINQTDLDVINTSLTGVKNETWTGTLKKTGAGAITTTYTGGTFKVNTGAALQIDAGTVNVGGTADMFTDNTGTATNGNHLAVINHSTTTLNITAGSKAVSTLGGAGNSSVSAGASLTANHVRQNQLTVNGNVSVRPNNVHLATSSEVNQLNVGASGKLDLTDNNLVVHGGDIGTLTGTTYSGLTGLVQEGRGDGTWNGSRGILTSMTDATTGVTTTLAIATADEAGVAGGVWGGVTVNSGDVLVKYTWGGDADLNGELNGDDYFYIDSSILAQVPGFHNGDFDYNGVTDGDDYFVLDSNILFAQGSQPFASSAAVEGMAAGSLAAVPEPGSIGLIVVAAGLSLPRALRRRRR